MKSYILEYKLRLGYFEQAEALIREFIEQVQNEEGTLLYTPFQYKEEKTKLIHVITFVNEAAEEKHKSADYTIRFFEELNKLCLAEPKYTEIEYINQDN